MKLSWKSTIPVIGLVTAAGLALSGKILICEDISCGVVPMDAETREWREAVGRMNAALAAQADTVTRIFCGLPLELKG